MRSTDVGDGGSPIGEILRITLVGFEALFDDVEIDVVGGPPPPPPPAFDVCLQDDSSHDILSFSSTTGQYLYTRCSDRFSIDGTGTLTLRGSLVSLQHNAPDRRVMASIDNGIHRGSASVQVLSLGTTLTITDRNTTNNTCSCP